MLSVALHIHPSPAKADIQYFGVETLFMPSFHWTLHILFFFFFFLAGAQWALCSGPGSAVWFRSFNLKLACKFESLGIGKNFLLLVLNSNYSEAHGQHFNLAYGQKQRAGEISLLGRPALNGLGLSGR